MKILSTALILALTLLSTSAHAGFITYNFAGAPGDQASTSGSGPTGITVGDISRGSGLTASGALNSISSSGWSTGALDLDDYYGFSLTIDSGFTLDLTSLHFAERRSGTGIRNFQVRASNDNFTTFSTVVSEITVPDNTSTRDQDFALSLNDLTGTIAFRIYGYNAEGTGGTWRLANHSSEGGLVLNGSLTAVPEPTTIALISLAAAGGAGSYWRKRRQKQQ